jgi:hypothetical protein
MATDGIVGIDLGTTNSLVAFVQGETPVVIPGEEDFEMDRDIQLLEVEKKLDSGGLFEEGYMLASRFRGKLAERIKNLKREMFACTTGGHRADLEESLRLDRARMAKIIAILGR